MKKLFCSTIALFLSFVSLSQTDTLFKINQVFIKDSTQFKTAKDFKKQDSAFFEDEKYVVRRTCSGEWGGTIWFKNKLTGIEYSCEATCPVVVNKVNTKYIVTSTLAHMSGFSSIIEIDNPDSLSVFKLPEPRQKKGKKRLYYISDLESGSKKASIQLLDSIDVLTMASFVWEGQLYHIVTDFHKTFIAKIEHKKFVNLQTISNESIWTYDPVVIQTVDKHSILFFSNEDAKGYLDIHDNKVDLIRYK